MEEENRGNFEMIRWEMKKKGRNETNNGEKCWRYWDRKGGREKEGIIDYSLLFFKGI